MSSPLRRTKVRSDPSGRFFAYIWGIFYTAHAIIDAMNKVASYLQSHISGEVFVGDAVRQHFSTDASVLSIKPSMVVYPRTTNDVRKIARFSWQLAERGHAVPITARGNGTDMTGAAIGRGIVLSFPAHLNKILELDTKQKLVRVQPGVNFKSLQETLHTHGLFLPTQPDSYEYSSIGGAIANNATGMRSGKYGDMAEWVDRLEVVLANGEVIQTGPVGKRELSKKLGLSTLEGELYRAVDAIINDNKEAITTYRDAVASMFDNVGYAFDQLRRKNGDVDLTRLFIGSQGTLGIITEAIIRVAPYLPGSALVVAAFRSRDDALEAAEALGALRPSSLELVENDLYESALKHNAITPPDELLIDDKPASLLFVELYSTPDKSLSKFVKQATKIMSRFTESIVSAVELEEREKLWSLRYATAVVLERDTSGKVALPLVQGMSVPRRSLAQFLTEAHAVAKKNHVDMAIWTHVQSGEVVAFPYVDLGGLGDRQKVFKVLDEYSRFAIKLGGSIATQGGEGRLRAPFAKIQTGNDIAALSEQLRKAADPHNMLNPGVKGGIEPKELVAALRKEFSFAEFAEFLPRL